MPLQATSGTASYDAFGGGVVAEPNYIESCFSTYLYTGNGSTQTITNGIDLAGKGGMYWGKQRNSTGRHWLIDSSRGGNVISSDLTDAQALGFGSSPFTSTGLSFTSANSIYNASGSTYTGWTFRKQQKFFDVVTYTGNGTANNTISHSLGSVPAFVIVKNTGASGNIWAAWHRSITTSQFLYFSGTNAVDSASGVWGTSGFTSSSFSVGTANSEWNANGQSYIAYLFAHNAGGFGLSGTDNVISCGSYTGNGSATGPVVTLGYEPQWLMIKNSTGTGNWQMIDNMRGMPVGSADATLQANLSNAESSVDYVSPTATGFQVTSTSTEVNTNASTYIYIAIRRGPMKVPTDATKVFGLSARSGTGANATVTGGQTDDAVLIKNRGSAVADLISSRLTGTSYLVTSSTAAEVAAGTTILQANPWDVMDGVKVGTTSTITNASGNTFINYLFKRAPSFMDVVCYNRASGATVTHNLGVTPELLIVKRRSGVEPWGVMRPNTTGYLLLNSTDALNTGLSATATSTTFTIGAGAFDYGDNYVAYLFATCAGVSKVGSYTGTGALQTVNCGFTSGARFVLIKRTDTTGDWWTYDSARGITSGNDPYLFLNSTAAEVTSTNYVDTDTTGFKVTAAAPAGLNASGGTYIFLAIA